MSDAAARKRARRVEAGRSAADAEAAFTRQPTQTQLMLPLLELLHERGGRSRPRDLYDRLVERLGLDPAVRDEKITAATGRESRVFDRQVRWARQTAVMKGLIGSPDRGMWELTQGGKTALRNARRGVVVTIFTTELGACVWGHVEDAMALVEPESVDLLFTSPPYPLLEDRSKAYGTMDAASWLDWMTELASGWKDWLTPTGSMIVNLGPVYRRGAPVQSAYIERFTLAMIDRLGLHLADRLYWHSPTKMPAPMEWVAVRRVRCKASVEPLLWFGKSENPKASNRSVLVPYAPSTLTRYIGKPIAPADRPSGFQLGANSFAADNGGSIPSNLIVAPSSSSADRYRRECRKRGLPIHPATMPPAVAERAILLTTDPGDLVVDPFFGSGTTGAVAERLGRRWLGFERSLAYAEGARLRFGETS
jgi:DNA modification methylase